MAAPDRAGHDRLDLDWTIRLLRAGFAVAAAGYAADVAQSLYTSETSARLPLPYDLLNVVVAIFALNFSLRSTFRRHWKLVTLAYCLVQVACWTATEVARGEQLMLFLPVLLLLLATCALVPWELGWQTTLTVCCLAGAAIDTALVSRRSPYIIELWFDLAAASALSLVGNWLWANWRRALVDSNHLLCEFNRKLRDGEARLQKLIDANLDQVSLSRLSDGRCVYVNDEFLKLGYDREEVLGRSFAELGMWDDEASLREFWRKVRSEGVSRNQEVNVRTRDGRIVPYLLSSLLLDFDGESYVLSVGRDITEIKHTERELIAAREAAIRASRAKSEFLSNMSHEIRTPMNAVLGMADLLAETPLDLEQRRYVDTMTRNGNGLLDLINDILDLAKVESGRLRIEEAEFGLNQLLDQLIELLRVRAHEKKIELAARILPDVPSRVVGDQLRLRQVLVNLAGNAIKFTDAGEVVLTIENASESDPGILRFSVRDTGIGIDAAKLATIFETFTQADSSTTRKYGGSGLGLAIAKSLVELMGGRIWVESELEHGSTFYFTARFGAPAGMNTTEVEAGPQLAGLKVLVVDDNATNRLILRETLTRRGADVTEADGGEHALTEWNRCSTIGEPFGLVLVDCRMPLMDGFELAQRLRSQSRGAKPIILMLTSDDLNPNLTRLRELGLSAYLVKPIKRSDLFGAIRTVIGESREVAQKVQTLPQAEARSADRALRILLVDDSSDNRMLIMQYLKKLPYEVDEAENGEVATRKFISGWYDLVLMDMRMPVMDGYAAAAEIRRWETGHGRAATPIVALTASALEADVQNCLKAGCTTHLSKPVKKMDLVAIIQRVTNAASSISPDEQPKSSRLPAPLPTP